MNRRTVRAGWAVRRWMAAICLVAVFSLVGCATAPSVPVQDTKTVTGKWTGSMTYQSSYGTTTSGSTWTINEDGTYVMSTGMWTAKGTWRLENGKIRFSDGPRGSGVATLHEGPDGRYLTSTGEAPGSFGTWTPEK